MSKKYVRRFILPALILLVLGAALFLAWRLFFDPYRGTAQVWTDSAPLGTALTAAQAREDLDYIAARVGARHPACVKGLPDAVAAAYARESAAIGAGGDTTVLALWQAAARVLHPLGDAHTGVRPLYGEIQTLPVAFAFEGKTLTTPGGAVAKIDGVPVAILYERFAGQFSYEMDAYARVRFAERINRMDTLRFVGIDPSGAVEIEYADGTTASYAFGKPTASNAAAEPFVSFEIDGDVGLFTLRACDYNDEYRDAVRRFFTAVRDGGIQNVILDLRDNPGGNSRVANAFIRYLPVSDYDTFSVDVRFGPFLWHNKAQTAKNDAADGLAFNGNLYVLTSATTFSSAVDFATLLSDNGLATLVGETPGNMPSSYGDVLSFQTPNAKLLFTVSYKRFVRPDATKSDEPLLPDVAAAAPNAMDAARALIGGL